MAVTDQQALQDLVKMLGAKNIPESTPGARPTTFLDPLEEDLPPQTPPGFSPAPKDPGFLPNTLRAAAGESAAVIPDLFDFMLGSKPPPSSATPEGAEFGKQVTEKGAFRALAESVPYVGEALSSTVARARRERDEALSQLPIPVGGAIQLATPGPGEVLMVAKPLVAGLAGNLPILFRHLPHPAPVRAARIGATDESLDGLIGGPTMVENVFHATTGRLPRATEDEINFLSWGLHFGGRHSAMDRSKVLTGTDPATSGAKRDWEEFSRLKRWLYRPEGSLPRTKPTPKRFRLLEFDIESNGLTVGTPDRPLSDYSANKILENKPLSRYLASKGYDMLIYRNNAEGLNSLSIGVLNRKVLKLKSTKRVREYAAFEDLYRKRKDTDPLQFSLPFQRRESAGEARDVVERLGGNTVEGSGDAKRFLIAAGIARDYNHADKLLFTTTPTEFQQALGLRLGGPPVTLKPISEEATKQLHLNLYGKLPQDAKPKPNMAFATSWLDQLGDTHSMSELGEEALENFDGLEVFKALARKLEDPETFDAAVDKFPGLYAFVDTLVKDGEVSGVLNQYNVDDLKAYIKSLLADVEG